MRLIGLFLLLTMSFVMTEGVRIRTLTHTKTHHGHQQQHHHQQQHQHQHQHQIQVQKAMMKQRLNSNSKVGDVDSYGYYHHPHRHHHGGYGGGGYGGGGYGGGGYGGGGYGGGAGYGGGGYGGAGGGAYGGAYGGAGAGAGAAPGAYFGAYPGAGPFPVPGQTSSHSSNNAQGNHVWDPTWTVHTPGNIVVTFTAATSHDIIFSFTSDLDPINPQTQNAWQVTLGGWADSTPQSTIWRGIQGTPGTFVPGQPCSPTGQRYWATLSATANTLSVGSGDLIGQNVIVTQQLDPTFPATMATRVGFSSWNVPVTYTNIIVTSQ